MKAAFEASGLLPLVYTPDEGHSAGGVEAWPTLRELIETGQRAVVFSEHAGGDPAWYLPQWEFVQDTPHRATTPSQLSCRHDRGREDAGLLLLNHWITTSPADRANAVRINTRSALLERVEQCEAERGMRVNIIAVDFSSIGDAIRVAEELNRRSPP